MTSASFLKFVPAHRHPSEEKSPTAGGFAIRPETGSCRRLLPHGVRFPFDVLLDS